MPRSKVSFITLIPASLLCLTIGWFLGRNFPDKDKKGEFVRTTAVNVSQDSKPEVATSGSGIPEKPVVPTIDFSLSPAVLLQKANAIKEPAKRQLYLKALLDHWIKNDPHISEEVRAQFLAGIAPRPGIQALGFEVMFSHYVGQLFDPSIREAWKSNYANHPARSEIFSMFLAYDMAGHNPESLFENSESWNPWESNRYNSRVLESWAKMEPNRAYTWYLVNPSLFGRDADLLIFDIWAEKDFDELSAHVNTIPDPVARNLALEAMAKQMAFKNTHAALDWANSLVSEEDQDFAHDTIYRETPRGIGAVLKSEDGFPLVVEPIVPNGLQPGDLIISAQNGNKVTDFYGEELGNSIEVLRGTPGTKVTLQIMRQDPATGDYHQVELTITREQLWVEKEENP